MINRLDPLGTLQRFLFMRPRIFSVERVACWWLIMRNLSRKPRLCGRREQTAANFSAERWTSMVGLAMALLSCRLNIPQHFCGASCRKLMIFSVSAETCGGLIIRHLSILLTDLQMVKFPPVRRGIMFWSIME